MSSCYFKNVTYTYPESSVATLDQISFNIEKGSFVLISGVSGSGKSTLGKIIKGIIPKLYGGRIKGKFESEEMGYVLQDPEKQMLMTTVERELAFGMENIGVPHRIMRKRVAEVLDYIGLSRQRSQETRTLSGGQKQKLAIGCAVAMGFNGIILDEPTGQLDPVSSTEVIDLLKRLNEEQGMTIILIEQKLDALYEAVDRVLFLEQGKLTFDGTPKEFVNAHSAGINDVLSTFTLSFKKAVDAQIFSDCPLSMKAARKMLSTKDMASCNALPLEPLAVEERPLQEKVISLRDVVFSYDQKSRHLSLDQFTLYKNDILGIIGENGSGKSTFMKVLSGVLTPQKGHIEQACQIGFLSQNPNDYFFEPTLRLELEQVLSLQSKEWSEHLDEQLDVLGLQSLLNKNPRDLSGGERQRAAMAIVLAGAPEVLLLDEPTRGLNRGLKRKLITLLQKLHAQGLSIVMISHDMELISDLTTKVAIISSGELQVLDHTHMLLSDGLFYVSDFGKLFSPYGMRVVNSKESEQILLNLKET